MKAKYLAAGYFLVASMMTVAGFGALGRNYSESSSAKRAVQVISEQVNFDLLCADIAGVRINTSDAYRAMNSIKSERAVRSIGYGTASVMSFGAAGILALTGFQRRKQRPSVPIL